MSKRMIFLIAIAALAAGFVAWKLLAKPDLPAGIASGNGRLEANELFVSAKIPGRVKEVLVDEGDTVTPGQVVARLDTEELEASLRQAEAQVDQARQTERAAIADVQTKRAQLNTRRAEIAEKQADLSYASQQSSRSQGLVKTGAVSSSGSAARQFSNARQARPGGRLAGRFCRGAGRSRAVASDRRPDDLDDPSSKC